MTLIKMINMTTKSVNNLGGSILSAGGCVYMIF